MDNLNLLFASVFIIYFIGIIAILVLPKKMSVAMLGLSGAIGSLVLFVFAAFILFRNNPYLLSLWEIRGIGKMSITVDHLSAFFLLVTAIATIPASIFASTRISKNPQNYNTFMPAIYLSLLISIVLVLVASSVFFFLLSWEVMSIFIYFLVNSGKKEHPGYVMLAIGEAGTLAILVALILLAKNANTFSFVGISLNGSNLSARLQWVVFLLSFFGFGIKGGLIPFNFWMPRAYNVTPSAFIPIIAGVTLNLGLYGIIRVNSNLQFISQIDIGIVILMTGAITAILGILYATIEDDLKTILAHSSMENAGIITTAFGASIVFLSSGHKIASAIALSAALYHILNHSIFKTLLFMGSGAIEDETGSRSLNQMGGLLKKMPWTGFFMLVGVLSISAMPPFNGFVSEWLVLESLLRSVELSSLGVKIAFIIAGALLALTAGLAITCFVRVFSMSFLGISRTNLMQKAKEVTKSTMASMAFLAFICLILGVLPTFIIPTINKSVEPIVGKSATVALVPSFFTDYNSQDKLPRKFVSAFHDIGAGVGEDLVSARGLVVMHRGGKTNPVIFAMSTSYMFVMMIFLLVISAVLVWVFVKRKRKIVYLPRWDGGIKELLPEMAYTATGFAQPVRVIFNTILHPEVTNQHENIAEYFRVTIRRKKEEVHFIDRFVLYPFVNFTQKLSKILAKMHNGRLNAYAGYTLLSILVALIIAFCKIN